MSEAMSLLVQLKSGIMTKCAHFRNSINNETCEAGVRYDDVNEPPAPGKPLRMPCYSKGMFSGADLPCDKRYFPSDEEAEKEARETEERLYANAAARKVAKDDARAKGYARGHAGQGEVICSRCGGRLRYTVAAVNGHMHGKCSTKGCVSWME